MKNVFLKTILLVGIAVAFATPANAVILGSKHDLSSGTGAGVKGTSDQTCVYCHTPHQANTALTGAPLWNHATPAATYTLYSSTTIDNGPIAQPGNISKACLSCHDGALSVGALLNLNGTTFTETAMTDVAGGATYNASGVMQSGTAFMVGIDLSNDHPVGFTITDGLDAGIKTLAVMGAAGMKFYGAGAAMECATCHDAHGTANTYFLRASTAGSAICTSCHIK